MIEIKNMELMKAEDLKKPLADAGELEEYLALNIEGFLAQNFGVIAKIQVKPRN